MIALPAGTRCAMHTVSLPGAPPAWCVILAPSPIAPQPDAVLSAGQAGAILTHDAGMCWPDRKGEALAGAIIANGGAVLVGFATLADAMGCAALLRKAGAA